MADAAITGGSLDGTPLAAPDATTGRPTGRRRWAGGRLAAAIALCTVAAGALAGLTISLLLPRFPDVPERLPASLARQLARLSHEPDWDAIPYGPALADVHRRGELVVGVRAYPRPAPVGRPAPPEPDTFDVAMARFLADRLRVRLRVVNLHPDGSGNVPQPPGVDLVLAGSAAGAGVRTVASAYTGGLGRLVVPRVGTVRNLDDVGGRRVCVASGSAYARNLERLGAVPRIYESAIRAVSAFMAGECDALAEDEVLVDRMFGLPEWRFYRTLDGVVAPDNGGGQAVLRPDDQASARWLDFAVRHWKTDGAFAAAREQRAADVGYEAALLLSGFVCHA